MKVLDDDKSTLFDSALAAIQEVEKKYQKNLPEARDLVFSLKQLCSMQPRNILYHGTCFQYTNEKGNAHNFVFHGEYYLPNKINELESDLEVMCAQLSYFIRDYNGRYEDIFPAIRGSCLNDAFNALQTHCSQIDNNCIDSVVAMQVMIYKHFTMGMRAVDLLQSIERDTSFNFDAETLGKIKGHLIDSGYFEETDFPELKKPTNAIRLPTNSVSIPINDEQETKPSTNPAKIAASLFARARVELVRKVRGHEKDVEASKTPKPS